MVPPKVRERIPCAVESRSVPAAGARKVVARAAEPEELATAVRTFPGARLVKTGVHWVKLVEASMVYGRSAPSMRNRGPGLAVALATAIVGCASACGKRAAR